MTRKIICSLLCLLLLTVAGCSQKATTPTEEGGLGYPLKITDSAGLDITIERKPDKFVSLAPAITEILFAIQADEGLVGVTEYCNYPAEALKKPKVGDFANPNIEVIMEQEPDLIFVAAGIQEDLADKFNQLGIKVITLDAENIRQVLDNILLAGEITGHVQEANRLVTSLEERIEKVEEQVETEQYTPTVFFEVWDDPLMTAGPDSFIDDLIKRAGGQNIAHDTAKRFSEFSQEILLERNPEIYLLNDHAHEAQDINKRPGYESLQAITSGHVYPIEDDLVTLPGPRLVDGLEQIAEIIHRFNRPD